MAGIDVAQARSDRAETESIGRFRRLRALRDTVDEASRRAQASMRLEMALRSPLGDAASRRP